MCCCSVAQSVSKALFAFDTSQDKYLERGEVTGVESVGNLGIHNWIREGQRNHFYL